MGKDLAQALREGDEEAIWAALELRPSDSLWFSYVWTLQPNDSIIKYEEALRLLKRGDVATQVALCRHADGRVREAALRVLQPEGNRTLMTLLHRANDWVPIIAKLSRERAIRAFPTADDDTLAQALPLVFGLTRRYRADHFHLIDAYRKEVAHRPDLARRLRRANRNGPLGLWTFRNLMGEDEKSETIAREGLTDAPPAVQMNAARHLVKDAGNWPLLMASRNPAVRRLALDIAPEAAREAALVDHHAGVRNDARYLLDKHDYAAHYRRSLRDPVKLPWIARLLLGPSDRTEVEQALIPPPGAVSGLGETGTRDDAALLIPLLKHPKIDIRLRAVESITRLLGDDAMPYLLAMLRDPSQKVLRAAVDGLVGSSVPLDAEAVIGWDLPTKMRLKLLERTDRWSALLAVLRHVEPLPDVEKWLDRWAKRSLSTLTPPRSGQAEEALSLLERLTVGVPPETDSAMRQSIEFWRKRSDAPF